MSELVRVALVAEGPTDKVVVESVLANLLGGRSFILKQLQPEESLPFGPVGTGWVGVYRWCRQTVARSGRLRDDILYLAYDVVVLHLDADVAGKRYADGRIEDAIQDLPCERTCPPPSASTNPLRDVLLRWVGERTVPPQTVLCTPSKTMEAWVLKALFPDDIAVTRGVECWPDAESRLGQQPLEKRTRKGVEDYRARMTDLKNAWPQLASSLTEAERFNSELRAVLPS